MPVPLRTDFDVDLGSLLRREPRLGTIGPVVEKAIGAVLVEPVNSRSVWRSIPPIRAASVRFTPSRTAASDESRRLWLAFFPAPHPDKTRLIQFGRRAATDRKEAGLPKPETSRSLGELE